LVCRISDEGQEYFSSTEEVELLASDWLEKWHRLQMTGGLSITYVVFYVCVHYLVTSYVVTVFG